VKEKPKDFNLLEEQWIPVLWSDGKVSRVGITEALKQAGRIRQIAASNPMDRVAILRFLLALLYWCTGNPQNEGSIFSGDSFPADCFSKLDDNEECFCLLGEGKRFYQDRDARERRRAVTDLIQEIPTGNNFWHFRHSIDQRDGLCPACCAMGLLRLPLFSVSGLPDLKSGINGTPPVYIVPLGTSLLKTLQASWVIYTELGEPAWVQPSVHPVPGQDVPLLTGLTLLSRRVWLHDPGPPGRCVGCGEADIELIRTCMFQSAGEQKNDRWNDPHVIYSNSTPRKASKAEDLTAGGRFRMDRPWPDLIAGVVESGKFEPADKPTSLLVVGFATSKAKNIDVWERTIGAQSTGSIQETASSMLRQWQKQGRQLEKRIARSKVEGAAAIAAIRPHVEAKVSAKVGELLTCADVTWEDAASDYRPMMEMVAQSLSPGFTVSSVQRRQQISSVEPDMRQNNKMGKKASRKKGGNK
jgi:CRISPR type I-E-associated protein CasA/Cse1